MAVGKNNSFSKASKLRVPFRYKSNQILPGPGEKYFETLLKNIDERIYVPCFWMGRFSIIKLSVILNLVSESFQLPPPSRICCCCCCSLISWCWNWYGKAKSQEYPTLFVEEEKWHVEICPTRYQSCCNWDRLVLIEGQVNKIIGHKETHACM